MADQTYGVTFEVPHSGGRAWHWVAAEFDSRLAAQVIPPVLAADLVVEVRRGRDGLRLRIAVTVRASDVAQAITAAWDVLEAASDVGGFDLSNARAEAAPAPLTLSCYRRSAGSRPGQRQAPLPGRGHPTGRGRQVRPARPGSHAGAVRLPCTGRKRRCRLVPQTPAGDPLGAHTWTATTRPLR